MRSNWTMVLNQGGRKQRLNNDFLIIVLEVILLVIICYLHSLSSGHYVDFYPINGTFQNYNPVRRLLAGQIPYKDFSDYLGMGHLYIGFFITKILGGTYQSSLIAFSFLNFVGVIAISLVIGRAIFGSWKKSLSITILFSIVILVFASIISNSTVVFGEILASLNAALGKGNSARFIRGLILPLTIAMMLLLYEKEKRFNKTVYRGLPALVTGVVAGFAFIWSNDYGISTWLCLIIMFIYVSIIRNKKASSVIRDALLALSGSALAVFIFVEVFTFGNFSNWVGFTLGTGGYQSWYYNSTKSYYLYDVDFSFMMLIQAFITIFYLYKIYKGEGIKEDVIRYGIPAFANMTCFCAVNEYKLLSGGDSREVAISVLFITVFYEVFEFILGVLGNHRIEKWLTGIVITIGLAWILPTAKEEFAFAYISEKAGEYVESMGGNMTSLYSDMQAAHEFLNGNEFFSTYASGQEVYENTYQPTGTDYIIHVLGDKQRARYLDQFLQGDFKYVVTIRKDFTDWEYWIERANWFFYRELYKDWHPVFSNEYETYWERNDLKNQNTIYDEFVICVECIDEATIKLIVDTDKNITGIANIWIDYQIEKRAGNRLAILQFQNMLKVQNIVVKASESYYESNYLRSNSKEFVPMTIENGHGELVLTSVPVRTNTLKLNEVTCTEIYSVQRE